MCFHSQVFLLQDFLKMNNQPTYVLSYTAALTTIHDIHSRACCLYSCWWVGRYCVYV